MTSFDNCRVFIVLNLIGGIHDTLGNGKGSKSSLLKFMTASKVLFAIFVEYFLSYLEVVSQLEAIEDCDQRVIVLSVLGNVRKLMSKFVWRSVLFLRELRIIVLEVGCPTIHFLSCSRNENEKGGLYKNLKSKICVCFDKIPAREALEFVVWSQRQFHLGFFQLSSRHLCRGRMQTSVLMKTNFFQHPQEIFSSIEQYVGSGFQFCHLSQLNQLYEVWE